MKTFKIAFFALLFMMTGVVSAAPLMITDTSDFIATGGNFSGNETLSYTGESVHLDSGTLSGSINHTFTIKNTGASGVLATFRLWLTGGSASTADNISDFNVSLGNSGNLAVYKPAGLNIWGVTEYSLLLAGQETVDLVVSGIFNVASYELTLETPLPAAAWLFGSALMGLFGASRRKSTAVAA